MSDYLVSVIIPCYNVEKYLDRCLESVVNQTYKNLEIILVDDGSTDKTPAMCDEWAKKDKRIIVIHKENDGLANARNSGIEIMTGDYAQFIDSDDFVDEDIIEFLLNLSVDYNSEVSRCGFYSFENDKDCFENYDTTVKIYNELNHDDLIIDLIENGYLSGVAWNKLYKSDVIKSHLYYKEDGCSEDILHNLRIYKSCQNVVFCNVPKYHYCINPNSLTNSSFSDSSFDIIRARKIFISEYYNNPKIVSAAREWYVRSSFIVISGCIRNPRYYYKYNELRRGIMENWKIVFFTKRFSFGMKMRVLILSFFPKLYNRIVITKGNV